MFPQLNKYFFCFPKQKKILFGFPKQIKIYNFVSATEKKFFLFSQARENIFVFPSKIKSLILFPQVNKFLIFDSASNNIFTCGNKAKDYFSLAETKKIFSKPKKICFPKQKKNLLFCSPSKKIYGSVERTLRKKINDEMINDDNSFNTRPPGPGGGHDNQLMYGPPPPGVTLSFCFGIFNDKFFRVCCILSSDNDLGHLIMQLNHIML